MNVCTRDHVLQIEGGLELETGLQDHPLYFGKGEFY